jgi:DeoR/GlpR family transcriptional regulator of sugar metabolism
MTHLKDNGFLQGVHGMALDTDLKLTNFMLTMFEQRYPQKKDELRMIVRKAKAWIKK